MYVVTRDIENVLIRGGGNKLVNGYRLEDSESKDRLDFSVG